MINRFARITALALSLMALVTASAAEERGGADFVVDIDAGGGATDGVNGREVGGSAAEAVHDSVVVVGRIFLEIGIPSDFFREDDFAIDECGAFAIGSAEVEADAVAMDDSGGFAKRLGFEWGGEISARGVFDDENLLEDAFDKFGVKNPCSLRRV